MGRVFMNKLYKALCMAELLLYLTVFIGFLKQNFNILLPIMSYNKKAKKRVLYITQTRSNFTI